MLKMEEVRDEQRVRDEMKAMAVAEGLPIVAGEEAQPAAESP